MPGFGDELPGEHAAGVADLCFVREKGPDDQPAPLRLVTGGANGDMCIRDMSKTSEMSRVSGPGAAVLALAGDPQHRFFAAAFDDCHVRLYSPSGDLRCVVAKCQLPARSLAFSPSGELLAIAGDDEGVRVMRLVAAEGAESEGAYEARHLTTLPAPAFQASVSYDPEGQFLAVAGQDGAVAVWDVATGKQVWHRRRAAPKSNPASGTACRVAWHPDGGCHLLVPGVEGDVQALERLSWSDLSPLTSPSLKGPIQIVAPSPNGLYVAAADRKGGVAVFEAASQKEVAFSKLDEAPWALAWAPEGNALAAVDAQGLTRVWQGAVPEGMASPSDLSIMSARTAAVQDGAAEDAGEGEGQGADEATSDDESMNDFIEEDEELGKRGKRRHRSKGLRPRPTARLPPPHPVVHPGSTPFHPTSRRRFLAYTPSGYVACLDSGAYQTIDAHMHDTMARARPINHNDFAGAFAAALSQDGVALITARGAKDGRDAGDASVDSIAFLSFDSWARGRHEWALPLPEGEAAACVAAGTGFLAAATVRRNVRVVTLGGVQAAVLALPGDPVALVGSGESLAAIYRAGPPSPDGDHALSYMSWDVGTRQLVSSGPVPLSPKATLQWAGFTEEGLLAIYDSTGVGRVRAEDWGGQWVPVFNASDYRKNDQEDFFMVGMSVHQTHCVVTRKGEHPQPHPRPVQQRFANKVPVLQSTGWQMEEERVRRSLLLPQARAAAAVGEGAAIEALGREEKAIDALSLREMNEALREDDFLKAYDLAAHLITIDMLEGAVRLVAAKRNGALTQRVQALLELRCQAEHERQQAEEEALMAQAVGVAGGMAMGGVGVAVGAGGTVGGAVGVQGRAGGVEVDGRGGGVEGEEEGEEVPEDGRVGDAPKRSSVPAKEARGGSVLGQDRANVSGKCGSVLGRKRVAEVPPPEQRTTVNIFARKKAA